MEIDETDRTALRMCAELCWRERKALKLTDGQIDSVLVAWMAVGTPEEGGGASGLLAARRATDAKQATFDRILGGGDSPVT